MEEQDRRELREFYIREYKLKTGRDLICSERGGNRPQGSVCKNNITRLSALYTGLKENDILSTSRKAELVEIRRWMIVILREYKVKMETIGRIIGDKHHTTAVTAIQKHTEICSVDKDYKRQWKLYRTYMKDELKKLYESTPRAGRKVSHEMLVEMKKKYAAGMTYKEIGAEYGVHKASVSRAVRGKYKYKKPMAK